MSGEALWRSLALKPRDVLFFRDARPMDTPIEEHRRMAFVGHGANWPRSDQFFNSAMHLLLGSEVSEKVAYGSIPDLQVRGSFPMSLEQSKRPGLSSDGGKEPQVWLPFPMDWDMALEAVPEGVTNLPKPLTHGFISRVEGKRSLPQWITVADYQRYLLGQIEPGEIPKTPALFMTEHRLGTTLNRAIGGSLPQVREHRGQWHAEFLRLRDDVRILVETSPAYAERLAGQTMRYGGQGGLVTCTPSEISLTAQLQALESGKPTCYLRWTLLSPALFQQGWRPNWVDEEGRVRLPTTETFRKPGETRAAWRARKLAEMESFGSARLVATCMREPLLFSGWDSVERQKPTELAVAPGTSYVFRCDSEEEAQKLYRVLNLRTLSDLGEKGFGFGLCSFVSPE